jgi:hypothetical protein
MDRDRFIGGSCWEREQRRWLEFVFFCARLFSLQINKDLGAESQSD